MSREDQLFIRGIGVELPQKRIDIASAVRSGLYDAERAEREGFSSVVVAEGTTPVEMTLAAAERAIGDLPRQRIAALFHTSINRHGHKKLWPPAFGIQRGLNLDHTALAVSLSSGCNSAFQACILARAMFISGMADHALVAGGDVFGGGRFDRFGSDLGAVYGDAAAAMLLSTETGIFRILHIDIDSESRLEEMYRDTEVVDEMSAPPQEEYDVGSSKKRFLERVGKDTFKDLFSGCLDRLRSRLLHAHPLLDQPVKFVIYPNVGLGISAPLYAAAFSDLAHVDHWKFGRSIGHVGTCDQLIGLHDLEINGHLKPDDRVLLIGAGNGLSAATMLLERTGIGHTDRSV
ncbi:hypothetical protein GOZ89_18345 [Agrobacterium vitis]|uniref:ketoacyl-ACP synthase III family protein n=1 Tax=Agrobacterium vitis TaxID=373 RepID=UPI000871FA59|nr:ketoacyl-ACP synthase III family protein [Agrobacterium vitis]MCE6076995.1 hypothetical protein [Agrobacterium vitis]MCF1455016.1 hypothetical protein [Agrobacterium vitis]MCF1469273.1 hypothetical protein [Agrobacterium vitis]MUO71684.1 hypothetical protein [Agrobacterium vitis]MUO86238.1 hypothetical protein [Agrobacterium vitis]